MKFTTPANAADMYKTGHKAMFPPKMTRMQSNWTARGSRIPGVTHTVAFGLQAYQQDILMEWFKEQFFNQPREEVVQRHADSIGGILGRPFNADHFRELHNLGYLPLRFSALPEGTQVPLRVPHFLVDNTHHDFAWMVNYLESLMSAEGWQASTSATLALRFRHMLDGWARKTSDNVDFVDWQGHDFSFRGMGGMVAASRSGAGHLLSFAGTDVITAVDWAKYYYGAKGLIGGSVPASEHSVDCAWGRENELDYFVHLLTVNPTGIVSAVSDTWDLWHVITSILPLIKWRIMARDGKLVIRPDSGDPVKILCGDPHAEMGSPAWKGVIQLLWEVFGGTVNSKGFKVLDSHIGVIYGDAITYERADEICALLAVKGFASTNAVLGIGSFTYQYVTRDTFGFAMKATWCEVDGVSRNLWKDPVTDDGTKRSAKGRLACSRDIHGELYLINEATPTDEAHSLYRPVWEDGKFLVRQSYHDIVKRVGVRKLIPS